MKTPLPDSLRSQPIPSRKEFASTAASAANQAVVARMVSFARVVSISSAAVGAIVLVGWFLGLQILKSVLPGLSSMKPNTAICLSLLAASLWFLAGHSL